MLTLDSEIEELIRLKAETKSGLKKLNIKTVGDLLYHFPNRYADIATFTSIANLKDGESATIRAVVKKIESKKTWKSKVAISEATVEDVSGDLRVVWFHQPYFAKMLSIGQTLELTGKVSLYKNKPTLINPILSNNKNLPIDSHDSLFANVLSGKITAIYPETKGISSGWLRNAIHRALTSLDSIVDHIPEELLKEYSLPKLKTALIWIHEPKKKDDALKARKRFAFDEIFSINLARAKEKYEIKDKIAYKIDIDKDEINNFKNIFSFKFTSAQEKSLGQILVDLEKGHPMSRLLEGDVGSGKTAVAAVAAYATVTNRPLIKNLSSRQTRLRGAQQSFGNLQVAYMAPTEILATQHFESFVEFFRGTGIKIALITGSGARKFPSKVASSKVPWTTISKPQLKKWIANGEIPIVIGTHALIQKSLEFKHLALVIIDEQHRFGLSQRKGLAKKDSHFPHLLSMTATPIPRTLALTIYGDLDLSLLDEMPIGRKQTLTEIIAPDKRGEVYDEIKKELKNGRQLYVICPRINESDPEKTNALNAKSVTIEAVRLKKEVFPEYSIAILHSKMTRDKKESVMKSFVEGKTDILVATSVVEVGVNVPNATVMIIEGAERFGLSQLHQLRGRIMRSTYQPYCYLFAESRSEKTRERLKYFVSAKNGFELAEYDLALRGTGELTGTNQWGISDIGMEALRNIKLVEAARESAKRVIADDPMLAKHKLLLEKVQAIENLHFE